MKLLVTGAGMLGTALAARLRSAGHDIVVADVVGGADVASFDLTRPETITPILDGVEGVFHTAAIHGFRDAPARSFFDVNVVGTWNLLEAMVDSGVSRLVHTSTVGVYGEASHLEIDDSTPLVAPCADPYNATKRMAEQAVTHVVARSGLEAVSLRCGGFLQLIVERFGSLPEGWARCGALVDLDDVVTAHVEAMARLPLPRSAYVVAPSGGDSTTPYAVDSRRTEADLGFRFQRTYASFVDQWAHQSS